MGFHFYVVIEIPVKMIKKRISNLKKQVYFFTAQLLLVNVSRRDTYKFKT